MKNKKSKKIQRTIALALVAAAVVQILSLTKAKPADRQ